MLGGRTESVPNLQARECQVSYTHIIFIPCPVIRTHCMLAGEYNTRTNAIRAKVRLETITSRVKTANFARKVPKEV